VSRFRNQCKTRLLPPNKQWIKINAQRLKGEIVILDAARRSYVEDAIRETCRYRGWGLQAMNVRTNHVHVVVSIGIKKPEAAVGAFKANATRRMREIGCWRSDSSPWADKGSNRYLWNERSVERVINYVVWAGRRTTGF
jgi:REP element-mobilizing transposase RayT